jgi:hypothetical protein
MSESSPLHLHFHEGVTREVAVATVEAAVKAAKNGSAPAAAPKPDPADLSADKKREYIERAYKESDPPMRKILDYLADHPDQAISYPEINKHMAYPTRRSLPGAMGAFGLRVNRRYEGFKPYSASKVAGDEWALTMDADTAEIIKQL